MNDGFEELANAIVLRAVNDYRGALRKLNKYPKNRTVLYTKREIEKFFYSHWYSALTSVDPKILIEKLNEEVQDDSQRIFKASLPFGSKNKQ